jgi:hypothetical protein
MKETFHRDGRSFYEQWLKPDNFGSYYPGNSPKFVNWDSSLNKEVGDLAGRMGSYCRNLVKGYEGYVTRLSRRALQV